MEKNLKLTIAIDGQNEEALFGKVFKGDKGDVGDVGPKGEKGDTPVMTVDADGTLRADGEAISTVIKDTLSEVKTGESSRTRQEAARVEAETSRVNAEKLRASAEKDREAAASAMATDEGLRRIAEADRQSSEESRKLQEQGRIDAEATRVQNETTRKGNETRRNDAETSRAEAETLRSSAEVARHDAEVVRQNQEGDRQSKETQRQSAEVTRQSTFTTNEAQRQSTFEANEATRQANYQSAIDNLGNSVVKTNVAQSLSLTNQAQARANIGASSEEDVSELSQSVNDRLDAILPLHEDQLAYGVEYDTASSSPTCTRIGNMNFHRSLPVQSLMKGCLLDDDGNVVKYLNPTSWTSETRDGSQGQVMVEIPTFYINFRYIDSKVQVWMSLTELPNYIKVSKFYISAYEATIQRSTTKLASVLNLTADYRGGNNSATNDANEKSLLGKAATQITLTDFRNYARKRKPSTCEWNCDTYEAQKWLYWLFVVEYASLNSQLAYTSELTTEGYRKGGLGDGVTNIDWNKWASFNYNYPFVPIGYTDELGNATGEKAYEMPESYGVLTTKVPRYRGIEHPFGHIWKWTDGVLFRIGANDESALSEIFLPNAKENYASSLTENYSKVGELPRTQAWIKKMLLGEKGEILPIEVGGGSSTYYCDYFYTNMPTSGYAIRGALFGGRASNGAIAGLVFASSSYAPSTAYPYIGSRLCFFPNTK